MENQEREPQEKLEKQEQATNMENQAQQQQMQGLSENQELNESQAQDIDIKIRTMDQNQFELHINRNTTVLQLKNLINSRIHIPIQYQRIIFQGKMLKNQESLGQYKLQNGSVLQLVANPPEEQLPVINPEQQQVNFEENNNPDEFIAGILRSALEPSLRRRRQLRQHRILDAQESVEIIRQSLTTVQQLFTTMNSSHECISSTQPNIIQPFNVTRKKLQLGQWIDVKDTVDQWLEAQVIEVSDTQNDQKVFIHYNGWPSHWDEWIESKSVRIAPFRTYTVQSSTCPFLSPSPTVNPDGMQNLQQQQQQQSPLEMLQQLSDFMEETKTMLIKLNQLYTINKHENQANQHQNIQEEQKTQSIGLKKNEEQKYEEIVEEQHQIREEVASSLMVEIESAEQKSLTSLSELIYCEEVLQEENNQFQGNLNTSQEYMLLSAQLSPVLDRLGRILSDFAPHLANIANARTIGDDNTSNSSMFTNEGSVQQNLPRVGQSVPVMQSPSELTRPLEGNVDIFIHAVISPQSSLFGGMRNIEASQQQIQEPQNSFSQQLQQSLQQAQRFPVGQQEFPLPPARVPTSIHSNRNNPINVENQVSELDLQQQIQHQQQIFPIQQTQPQTSLTSNQVSQQNIEEIQQENSNSNEEREKNDSSCGIF